jgi:hypothetical protein
MTLTADRETATPVTPTDLLTQVRAARTARDAADVQLARLAVEWAHSRPALDASGTSPRPSSYEEVLDGRDAEAVEWYGVPEVSWDAFAPFAAAVGLSTQGGKAFVRDCLVGHHRLPRLWRRVEAGQVPTRRLRQVAQAVLGQPADVCTYVDLEVAHRAETLGPVVLDRILDEAKLRLHAEERELEQLEALDARFVQVDEASINHTGIADLHARGDWADVKAFDETVGEVAAALASRGCADSVDVRRSMALGILANPERALALLEGRHAPTPKRRVLLTYHLTDAILAGIDPVGFDVDGRPLLDQLVRQWCGRDDVRVVVQPLLALGTCRGGEEQHDGHPVEDYRPNAADLLEVELRDRACVYPYCTRPARRCDCDHVVPFDLDNPERGPTCPCNLAVLCRHHHRLKTLAGWRYTIIERGIYLWSDPHGQRFLRTPDGTHDLTDPEEGRRRSPQESAGAGLGR